MFFPFSFELLRFLSRIRALLLQLRCTSRMRLTSQSKANDTYRTLSNTIEHFMRDRIDPNSGYFPVQIAGAEVHNVPHMLDLQNAAVHCSLFTVLICSDWLDNLYFFHFRLISNRIFQVYQERRGLLWEKSHVGSDI